MSVRRAFTKAALTGLVASASILAAGARLWSRPVVDDARCFSDQTQEPCPPNKASGGCVNVDYWCSSFGGYPPRHCVSPIEGYSCAFSNNVSCGTIMDCNSGLPKHNPPQTCSQTVDWCVMN